MGNHLDDIVALHDALTEVQTLEERLNGIPESMQAIHDEHGQRKEQMTRLEAEIEEAQADRRSAETLIAEAQQKLERYQSQINMVTTQREYGALLQEIDTVKGHIQEGEALTEDSNGRREAAEEQLGELEKTFSELDESYQRELAAWESEKPQMAARIEALKGTVEALRERTPRNVVGLFERIRTHHGGDGIAQIQEIDRGKAGRMYHCSACHYRVRPQVVVQVRNEGRIVQCDSCKRVLYLAPAEEAEEVAEEVETG